jgi:hypothetical protein
VSADHEREAGEAWVGRTTARIARASGRRRPGSKYRRSDPYGREVYSGVIGRERPEVVDRDRGTVAACRVWQGGDSIGPPPWTEVGRAGRHCSRVDLVTNQDIGGDGLGPRPRSSTGRIPGKGPGLSAIEVDDGLA